MVKCLEVCNYVQVFCKSIYIAVRIGTWPKYCPFRGHSSTHFYNHEGFNISEIINITYDLLAYL